MRNRLKQMGRYAVKGAVATVANVLLMSAFVELGPFSPDVAAVVSTLVLIPLLGYPMMNRFVFKTNDGVQGRRLAKYATTILAGKSVNYALFLGLLAVGVWYPLAWIVGSGVVFLGTFTVNRRVWRGGAGA